MHVIPKYLLVVSQNFGLFPLEYVKNEKGEESIVFSRNLFIRGIILVSLIIASSIYALYVDMEAYFTGQKGIRIRSNLVGVLADVLSLIMDLVVVFVSLVKKHPQFTEMCNILQTTDKDLHVSIKHSTFKRKTIITYACITTLVSFTVFRGMSEPRYILYVPVLCSNILEAAWLLQFTFLVETMTIRFQILNKMIENQIRKEIIQKQNKKTSSPNRSVTSSPSHPLKILIDLYSQLCVAVEQAKDVYRGQILGKVSNAFIHIIFSLYYFLHNFQGSAETMHLVPMGILGAWSIVHILHLLLLILPCASLTNTSEKTAPMISGLMNEDENCNNKQVINQLETFLVQLLHYDVQFSASGLFPIHRHIIISIVSAVVTYLIVFLQMGTSTS